jgi:hypothetical protein
LAANGVPNRHVLLFSGGLDSAAAWWVLGQPPWLHFASANLPGATEIRVINQLRDISPDFAAAGEIVEMDWSLWKRKDMYAFPREHLCALRCWARGYDRVWTGWHVDDGTLPTTYGEKGVFPYGVFVGGETDFKLLHPVQGMGLRRADLVRAALDAGASLEFLTASFSCHHNRDDGRHCGRCQNCSERHVAFLAAGVKDPTDYADPVKPYIVLKEHLSDPVFEQQYRKALGLSDGELLTVFGEKLHSLDGLQRHRVVVDKTVGELKAISDNGAMVTTLALGPAGRKIVAVPYMGLPVPLRLVLKLAASKRDMLPLQYLQGQQVDVYVGLAGGDIKGFEVTS